MPDPTTLGDGCPAAWTARPLIAALLVLLAALLIAARAPYLFTTPRFWAEEGEVFFAQAFTHPWYQMPLFAHAGYYSLVPNVACMVAAKCVPLESAPLVTTLVAFCIQLIPHLLVFFPLRSVFPRLSQRILLSAVILFVGNQGEMFLCALNSSFHLGVAAFLIMLIGGEPLGAGWRWFQRLLLMLAGLTGLVSCFFLPLFVLKAYWTRRREPLVLAAILLAAALVQLTEVVPFLRHQDGARPGPPSAAALARMLAEQMVARPIWAGRFMGDPFCPNTARCVAGTAVACLALVMAALARPRREPLLVLLAFLFVGALILSGSLGGVGGWRYAYIPGVIITCFFVQHLYLREPGLGSIGRLLCVLILGASLSGWMYHYRGGALVGIEPYRNVAGDWPSWRQEVARWRESPDHRLAIWPQWPMRKWEVALPAPPIAQASQTIRR